MTGPKAPTSWVPARVRSAVSTAAQPLRRPPFWVGTAVGAVAVLLAVVVVPLARGDRDAQEDGPLVILSGQDDSVTDQRQKLVDEWNSMHPPNEQARIEELSPLADDQHSEMLARAQSADPDVDVYNLDVTWTTEFAAAGHIRRLDESRVPTAEFLAGPLSTCRYDGGLYALPFNADVGLLYYRSDLLERIGQKDAPPQDWDTLTRQVEALKDLPDVDDAAAGYVGQLDDYEGLTVTALEMIWGERGTVVDDDGRVLPDGDDDVQAMQNGLERLAALSPADRSGLDEAGSIARFRDGEALFMRNWPVAARRLKEPGDKPAPAFAVAPLPGGSAALGGQNLAISTRTTRPRAARALVEFLTGDRSQQLLFERGGLPATRRVVYLDPLFREDLVAKTLRGALDGAAHPRPAVARYTEFSTAFRDAVNDYFRDPDSLREDALRADLEAALSGRLPPDGGG